MYVLSNLRALPICALTVITLAAQSALPALNRQANAQLPTRGSLTVAVTGLRNTEGQVCFSLYAGGDGFPESKDAILAKQCVAAATVAEPEVSNQLTVSFSDLESGSYAVSVLHDENGDDQINTGTFGVPLEGFGFSRNPAITTRAPNFSEAAVFVVGDTATQIGLIYY
jgi:uncharacterized protein (DUF2141 family)